MKRAEMFQNLVVMAAADGQLNESEVTLLAQRAERWGLTEEQVDTALESAKSADFQLVIPVSKISRIEMIRELIRVMAADGELADIEKKLLAIASVAMEIPPEEFDEILDTM